MTGTNKGVNVSVFGYTVRDTRQLLKAWEAGLEDPDRMQRAVLARWVGPGRGFGDLTQEFHRSRLRLIAEFAVKKGITWNLGTDPFWEAVYGLMPAELNRKGFGQDVRIQLRDRVGTLRERVRLSGSNRLAVMVRFDGADNAVPVSSIDIVFNAKKPDPPSPPRDPA